jgi:hypothetical protein
MLLDKEIERDMETFPLQNFRITLPGLIDRIRRDWCLASYLIINWKVPEIRELAELELPESFTKAIAQYVYDYVYEDKMPPDAIAQTVLNISEDMMAGRTVQLRAGDYIAVQQFLRSEKRIGKTSVKK